MKRTRFLLLLLILPLFISAQKSPLRVEPPFWWAGMYHTELQILVYEPNISSLKVRINHPGILVKEVVAVDSPNYLFIYLDVSQASPGFFQIEFMDGKKLRYTYQYELRKRDENAMFREGFDASDAIYLLMPDRFVNGEPGNDDLEGMLEKADKNNPDGRHGGDIQGIINHLDYIEDLGFTAIWLNPVFENNQPRYSYHGYAITDFYKVDPRFGTNEDYRRLVQEAEKKGIKIIKDMIFNHCGSMHWWMTDLPSKDWINLWPEYTRTSYRMTTIVDPHASDHDYDIMVKGWFDANMPDLNQHNRLLAQYLKQNTVWWIEFAGIQGIRMDTQPYAEKDFMAEWANYITVEYPYFRILGEAWMGIPAMVSYYQQGKINHDGYNSNIPSLFDFPLYDAVREAFNEEPGWNEGLMRLYNMLAQDFLYPDPYNLVVFPDNHDVSRIFSSLDQDTEKLKMLLTFIFTTRGIPMMYYGTEILMTGLEHKGHGGIRMPFPGGWPGDETNAFSSEGRNYEQNDVVNHIRKLLHFRQVQPALHYGWLMHFIPHDNVYVYFRYDEESSFMIVINSNEEEKSLDSKRFAEATNGYHVGRDVLTGFAYEIDKTWNVPGNSAMVLELKSSFIPKILD
jgi:neopullulanase